MSDCDGLAEHLDLAPKAYTWRAAFGGRIQAVKAWHKAQLLFLARSFPNTCCACSGQQVR
jgi:hypothetical protein